MLIQGGKVSGGLGRESLWLERFGMCCDLGLETYSMWSCIGFLEKKHFSNGLNWEDRNEFGLPGSCTKETHERQS